MEWSIIADSSCDFNVRSETVRSVCFAKVPFVISIDNNHYTDDESLDVDTMIDAMESSPHISQTACPSPQKWLQYFEQADKVIAVTISSQLSGSYESAVLARQIVLEKYPHKKIYILDSLSAGSALSLYVQQIARYIEEEPCFEKVVERINAYKEQTHTIFALCSFGNLIKNGRINKVIGTVLGKLHVRGIGIGSQGSIVLKEKVRGDAKMILSFLTDMKENGFQNGKVIITHCQNIKIAEQLERAILDTWNQSSIQILPTKGLCSYYAERKGIIVAYCNERA